MKKNNGKNGGLKTVAGVGTLLAAAAGAYFLYGTKKGKKVRKDVGDWSIKVKEDVVKKVKNLEGASEAAYKKVVDEVVKKYEGVKNVDWDELTSLGKELKGHWKNIVKQVKEGEKKAKKNSKK